MRCEYFLTPVIIRRRIASEQAFGYGPLLPTHHRKKLREDAFAYSLGPLNLKAGLRIFRRAPLRE